MRTFNRFLKQILAFLQNLPLLFTELHDKPPSVWEIISMWAPALGRAQALEGSSPYSKTPALHIAASGKTRARKTNRSRRLKGNLWEDVATQEEVRKKITLCFPKSCKICKKSCSYTKENIQCLSLDVFTAKSQQMQLHLIKKWLALCLTKMDQVNPGFPRQVFLQLLLKTHQQQIFKTSMSSTLDSNNCYS